MNGFVSNTDYEWFTFLNDQPQVDEINFWKPLGTTPFRALKEGDLFLFKLKKQFGHKIVGFGQFLMFDQMSVVDAWDNFGIKNGARSLSEMFQRIDYYLQRNRVLKSTIHHKIGCIIITNPVFFPKHLWVNSPEDWKDQIVSGKSYDLSISIGKRMFSDCLRATELLQVPIEYDFTNDSIQKYTEPVLTRLRLGQGGFRLKIKSIYGKCAVSEEHSVPALEAAHIRPYSEERGGHDIQNGILLRSDIHKLYDRGYVSIDTDYKFQVSDSLKDEFNNGKTYYQLDKKKIWLPNEPGFWPAQENLEYHMNEIFRG
jgi:putative restriction endonuclease